MKQNNKLYCAVYRCGGGRENYQWKRSAAMSHSEAISAVDEITRGGRVAYLVDYNQSMAIGLPETFDNEIAKTSEGNP